MGDKKK